MRWVPDLIVQVRPENDNVVGAVADDDGSAVVRTVTATTASAPIRCGQRLRTARDGP